MTNLPEQLRLCGVRQTFKKGTHIFNAFQRIEKCYFIERGTAKVYIDHLNGKRSILDFFQKGNWLGEFSLFLDEDIVKENTVLQDIECLEYDVNELRRLCLSDPEVSYYFATYLTHKVLKRSHRLSEYMNYPLKKKLAQFILEYEESGRYEIAHVDAAEYLNVSYRHLLFTLRELCEEKVLTKKDRYVISNRKQLEVYASSEND